MLYSGKIFAKDASQKDGNLQPAHHHLHIALARAFVPIFLDHSPHISRSHHLENVFDERTVIVCPDELPMRQNGVGNLSEDPCPRFERGEPPMEGTITNETANVREHAFEVPLLHVRARRLGHARPIQPNVRELEIPEVVLELDEIDGLWVRMISGAPVMTDEEAVRVVDEAVVDWEEDVLVKLGRIPLQHPVLMQKGLFQLEEPESSIAQDVVDRVQTSEAAYIGLDDLALWIHVDNGVAERLPCGNTSLDKRGIRLTVLRMVHDDHD